VTPKQQALVLVAESFLQAPARAWEGMVDKLSQEEARQVSEVLVDLAILTVRAASYLTSRQAKFTHEASVAKQNKASREVRKALGYTYHSDNIKF
jgi:hypothetical protein